MDLDFNNLSLGNESQKIFENILDALSKGDDKKIGKILERGRTKMRHPAPPCATLRHPPNFVCLNYISMNFIIFNEKSIDFCSKHSKKSSFSSKIA